MAVFSASLSPDMPQERPPHPMDMQLLPVEELLGLWAQTQQVAWVMTERGLDAFGPEHYSGLVVWELQRRLILHPELRFTAPHGSEPDDASAVQDGALPHIMTVRL